MTGEEAASDGAKPPEAQAAPAPAPQPAAEPSKGKGMMIAIVAVVVVVVIVLLVYFLFMGNGGGTNEFTAAEWNTEASGTELNVGDYATLDGGDSGVIKGEITNITLVGVELDGVDLNLIHDFSSYSVGDNIEIAFTIEEALGIETVVVDSVTVV